MKSSRIDAFVANLPPQIRIVARALLALWDDWLLLIGLNTLWLLSWLTIVLGPPATFGLYHVAQRLVEGRVASLRDMVTGGRRYFVKSWQWMVVHTLVMAVLGVALVFYNRLPYLWARLFQGIVLVLIVLWLTVQFYALPYMMVQKRKFLRLAWQNGWITAKEAPGYTLVVVLSVASFLILFVLTQGYAFFLGGMSLLALMGCQAVQHLLQSAQPKLPAEESPVAEAGEEEKDSPRPANEG